MTNAELTALINEKLRRENTADESFTNAVADVFKAIVDVAVPAEQA